jgi:hypothetical protein
MLYSRSIIPHLNLGVGFSKGFFTGQKSLTKIWLRDFTNALFTVKNPSTKFRCGIFQRLFSRSKIPLLNLGEGFYKCFIHGQKSLT